MKTFAFALMLAAAASLSHTAAFADCPDEIKCSLSWAPEHYQDLGKIKTPTCYKFGKGCRPWHCNGYKDTNSDYWLDKCIQTFNVKHDKSHSNERLVLTIKGGIVGNYSRSLK